MDLLSLLFVLRFLTSSHENDGKACRIPGYRPLDMHLRASFGYAVAAGAVSSLVIVWFFEMSRSHKIWNKDIEEEMDNDLDVIDKCGSYLQRSLRLLVMEKKLILPLIIAMGAFVSNWTLWGSEYPIGFEYLPLDLTDSGPLLKFSSRLQAATTARLVQLTQASVGR